MSLISIISDAFTKDKKQSVRESAKQRLHLVLINDRANQNAPDFLPKLRLEILDVLKKYVPIASEDDVEINIEQRDETSIMEMSISFDKKDIDNQ
ncbi:Cell division topological specificity factor [Anaerobiospirillum thomasii]|uniref:Cell division topological specificity factor n=1 Tax=Anaerobiospirillum thomasii TaxID=179995 RepID=A0A2X0VFR4_9GAMM|nr:cell division topological specificity factor MinE [Anaerobiospirillum thomasii]SPT68338.1 Cell division topological specificity factor [Anaerobiospirillum thomasii]SPT70833.1 Cell division topological specificity factor [Anaerobiospirillum thomasii]